ncbi:MAG TPA: hypothetical protein VKZ41_13735 [Gemmatimonadales bacterium]|nr:hypothetical protein [Gemmatimonadales bacterium]
MIHRTTFAWRTLAPALLLALSVPAATSAAQGTPASASERAIASSSVLPGEFRAAPIVFSPTGPMIRGQVVGTSGHFDSPSFAKTDQIQFQDRIYVVPPGGASLGMSFVVVDSVATLPGGGIVMLPTGVVRIERAADGQAATARVVEQFAPMRVGQHLLSMENVPPATPNPSPVSEPVGARVAWRPGAPALPGVLQWMVLEQFEGTTYSPGDRITLVRTAKEDTRYGVTLPEEELGEAIVVRSGTHGVTALLLNMEHGAISEGTVARRSARGN